MHYHCHVDMDKSMLVRSLLIWHQFLSDHICDHICDNQQYIDEMQRFLQFSVLQCLCQNSPAYPVTQFRIKFVLLEKRWSMAERKSNLMWCYFSAVDKTTTRRTISNKNVSHSHLLFFKREAKHIQVQLAPVSVHPKSSNIIITISF